MKEIGSWLEYTGEYFDLANNGLLQDGKLFTSGSAALQYLVTALGIRELHVPHYYCDVPKYLRNMPDLKITTYPVDDFFNLDVAAFKMPAHNAGSPAAFLVVDFFGKRDASFELIRAACAENRIPLIIDRTHSLLNRYEETGIEFASIRKLLVHLPGGLMRGVNYSGEHQSFSIDESVRSLDKKRRYLESRDKELKSAYLSEMRQLESSLAAFTADPKALESDRLAAIVQSANLAKMSDAHRRNYAALLQGLAPAIRARAVRFAFGKEEVPAYFLFSCVSEGERDALKKCLIDANIYPALHWENGTDISSRLLSFPIDHRYTPEDMARIASTVNAFYDSRE